VKAEEGTVTVNLADTISHLTGGWLKSSVHRVVAPPKDQVGFHFFFFRFLFLLISISVLISFSFLRGSLSSNIFFSLPYSHPTPPQHPLTRLHPHSPSPSTSISHPNPLTSHRPPPQWSYERTGLLYFARPHNSTILRPILDSPVLQAAGVAPVFERDVTMAEWVRAKQTLQLNPEIARKRWDEKGDGTVEVLSGWRDRRYK
jgi:hypothetical protein